MPKQSPPPFLQQAKRGRFLAPRAVAAAGVVMPSRKAPLHILLALEGGFELEIPLSPGTLRKLRNILAPYGSEKQPE